jgi:hypothetical protein
MLLLNVQFFRYQELMFYLTDTGNHTFQFFGLTQGYYQMGIHESNTEKQF